MVIDRVSCMLSLSVAPLAVTATRATNLTWDAPWSCFVLIPANPSCLWWMRICSKNIDQTKIELSTGTIRFWSFSFDQVWGHLRSCQSADVLEEMKAAEERLEWSPRRCCFGFVAPKNKISSSCFEEGCLNAEVGARDGFREQIDSVFFSSQFISSMTSHSPVISLRGQSRSHQGSNPEPLAQNRDSLAAKLLPQSLSALVLELQPLILTIPFAILEDCLGRQRQSRLTRRHRPRKRCLKGRCPKGHQGCPWRNRKRRNQSKAQGHKSVGEAVAGMINRSLCLNFCNMLCKLRI